MRVVVRDARLLDLRLAREAVEDRERQGREKPYGALLKLNGLLLARIGVELLPRLTVPVPQPLAARPAPTRSESEVTQLLY